MPKLNLQMVVPPVRAVVKGPNEVDNFPEPCAERLATAPTTHEVIHLEVPLVIEVRSMFCIPMSTDGSPRMPPSHFAILALRVTTEATCPSLPYPPSKLWTLRLQALVEIDAAIVTLVATSTQTNFALSFSALKRSTRKMYVSTPLESCSTRDFF